MRFQKGRSANPQGRPRGIRDKRTKLRQALEADGERLLAKLVEMAMGGDTESLRFLLSRLLPVAKDLPVTVSAKGTLAEQGNTVVAAMMAGRITASEGSEMLSALMAQVRIVEGSEIERRLAALEARLPREDE